MEQPNSFGDQELETCFQLAVDFVSHSNISASNDDKLRFYGLFKQATVGPCNTAKPSIFDMTGRYKWDVWSSLGKMNKEAAMVQYIEHLDSLAPHWQETKLDRTQSKKSSGSETGGPIFSRPQREEEVETNEENKDISYWTSQGDIEMVKNMLQKGANPNSKTDEGLAALHYACDRGHKEIVQLLVKSGADVNLPDNEGMTPAHYAALVENAEVLEILKDHGADFDLLDNEGSSVWKLTHPN